jgi:hypothetical protein
MNDRVFTRSRYSRRAMIRNFLILLYLRPSGFSSCHSCFISAIAVH